MTGAILGDLAAWTWENEPDKFYPQLVSINAHLSVKGKIVLECFNALFDNKEIEREQYERIFGRENYKDKVINALIRSIVIGWIYDVDKDSSPIQKYSLHEDKEDWYATHFLAGLICFLRKGASKKEAAMVKHIGVFRDFVPNWKDVNGSHWKEGNGPLSILVRAWIAFYDSFDFTSAIHNAMQLPGDKHVNGILVGALAGAMYGSDQILLKKKFCKDSEPYHFIQTPDRLQSIVSPLKSYEINARSFFPKNRAFTNVELHQWVEVKSPVKYLDIVINKELARRILKAFDTGWDCRYGFYLDDGFVYVYRSGVLLCRFKLEIGKPIRQIQVANDFDKDAAILGFECAMESVELYWYQASTEEKPANLDYCKYYHGETMCPEIFLNSVKAKFWHGELLFVVHNEKMSKWKRFAKTTKSTLSEKDFQIVEKYSMEELALVYFIKSSYEEWYPFDETNWVYEY